MDKETVTEALNIEYKLEQNVEALHKTLIKPLSEEPATHSATAAKKACEAINTATGDLRKVLYNMFLSSDTKK